MVFRKYYWLLLFSAASGHAFSQSGTIEISGRVTNKKGTGTIYQVIVLNQRTDIGMLANSGGYFTIQALKSDTVLVNAPGFIVKKICFNDSADKNKYEVKVRLDSLHYDLPEVAIYPHRNLEEIKEEEKKLGVIPNTNLTKTCDTSPLLLQLLCLNVDIDGLYEKWSAKEREKRHIARLGDDQLKRNILKEIFTYYRKNNVINMEDNEFDKFIDYCNFTDNFIKSATEYELVMAVKTKYEQFENNRNYVSQDEK